MSYLFGNVVHIPFSFSGSNGQSTFVDSGTNTGPSGVFFKDGAADGPVTFTFSTNNATISGTNVAPYYIATFTLPAGYSTTNEAGILFAGVVNAQPVSAGALLGILNDFTIGGTNTIRAVDASGNALFPASSYTAPNGVAFGQTQFANVTIQATGTSGGSLEGLALAATQSTIIAKIDAQGTASAHLTVNAITVDPSGDDVLLGFVEGTNSAVFRCTPAPVDGWLMPSDVDLSAVATLAGQNGQGTNTLALQSTALIAATNAAAIASAQTNQATLAGQATIQAKLDAQGTSGAHMLGSAYTAPPAVGTDAGNVLSGSMQATIAALALETTAQIAATNSAAILTAQTNQSTLTAAQVDTLLTSSHGAGSWSNVADVSGLGLALETTAQIAATNSTSIKTDTTTLLSRVVIPSTLSTWSPAANVLTIVRGDSYSSAFRTPLDISKPTGANWPTSLAGLTITLSGTANANCSSTGAANFSWTGTATVLTGDSQNVRFQPTATQTSALKAIAGSGTNTVYDFDIQASDGTNRATLIIGTMDVKLDYTLT
jgi:hypothetical protein